jgi:hypothetical protein
LRYLGKNDRKLRWATKNDEKTILGKVQLYTFPRTFPCAYFLFLEVKRGRKRSKVGLARSEGENGRSGVVVGQPGRRKYRKTHWEILSKSPVKMDRKTGNLRGLSWKIVSKNPSTRGTRTSSLIKKNKGWGLPSGTFLTVLILPSLWLVI